MSRPESKKLRPVGKWIEGLDADMPVVEAAAKVLDTRLRGVESMVPRAAESWRESPEYVHQLRVSTRRSGAALRVFGAYLSTQPAKAVRRHLKKLRQAAGEARNCDVMDEAFRAQRSSAPKSQRKFIDDLLEWNTRARQDAQRHVRNAARRHTADDLANARRRLLDSLVEPAATMRLHDHAAAFMPKLIGAMREAALADLDEIDNLHELRIQGKRLRYAMEIVAPCYGDRFAEAYGRISSLQERLGAINDSGEFAQLIETFVEESSDTKRGKPWRAAAEAVLTTHRREGDERVATFLDEWRGGAWSDLPELASLDDGATRDDASARIGPEDRAAPETSESAAS